MLHSPVFWPREAFRFRRPFLFTVELLEGVREPSRVCCRLVAHVPPYLAPLRPRSSNGRPALRISAGAWETLKRLNVLLHTRSVWLRPRVTLKPFLKYLGDVLRFFHDRERFFQWQASVTAYEERVNSPPRLRAGSGVRWSKKAQLMVQRAPSPQKSGQNSLRRATVCRPNSPFRQSELAGLGDASEIFSAQRAHDSVRSHQHEVW